MKVKLLSSLQLFVTPMGCSLPGSSVHRLISRDLRNVKDLLNNTHWQQLGEKRINTKKKKKKLKEKTASQPYFLYWRLIYSCRKHEPGQCSWVTATLWLSYCPLYARFHASPAHLTLDWSLCVPIFLIWVDHILRFSLWLYLFDKISINTKNFFSNACERKLCAWCITCEAIYKRKFSTLCPWWQQYFLISSIRASSHEWVF